MNKTKENAGRQNVFFMEFSGFMFHFPFIFIVAQIAGCVFMNLLTDLAQKDYICG